MINVSAQLVITTSHSPWVVQNWSSDNNDRSSARSGESEYKIEPKNIIACL